MTNTFNANFAGSAIGSFPHSDIEGICSLVMRTIPEVPCWPQLTANGYQEEMCVQYTEGLPCFRIDYDNKTACMDVENDFAGEMETFYEKYLAKDMDYFAISKKFASGFHAFIERLEQSDMAGIRALKGQIVGPITLAGITKDSNKIAAINNESFLDAIVKTLGMKAAWQLDQYKKFNLPRIIFVDEPYLSSIGSAFANIKHEQAVNSLNEIFEVVHERGALVGIHCCGNTDFSMLMETTVDIINFDAYGYMDELLLYSNDVKNFFERGGILAWGLVPTSDDIKNETVDSLLKRFDAGIEKMKGKGMDVDVIFKNSLITPSCGTGSLSVETADQVMETLKGVTDKLKERL